MKRYAFTMVELIFAIVIIGILAAIAIPRLAATRDDAQIAKGRSDVASVRAAIVSERQSRLLQGQSNYISKLHNGNAGNFDTIFDSNGSSTLLQYGIATKEGADGHWDNTVAQVGTVWRYIYRVSGTDINFDYNSTSGTFTCDNVGNSSAEVLCRNLID